MNKKPKRTRKKIRAGYWFFTCGKGDTTCNEKNEKINAIINFYLNELHINITNPDKFSSLSVEQLTDYANNDVFIKYILFEIKDDSFYKVDFTKYDSRLNYKEKEKIKNFIYRQLFNIYGFDKQKISNIPTDKDNIPYLQKFLETCNYLKNRYELFGIKVSNYQIFYTFDKQKLSNIILGIDIPYNIQLTIEDINKLIYFNFNKICLLFNESKLICRLLYKKINDIYTHIEIKINPTNYNVVFLNNFLKSIDIFKKRYDKYGIQIKNIEEILIIENGLRNLQPFIHKFIFPKGVFIEIINNNEEKEKFIDNFNDMISLLSDNEKEKIIEMLKEILSINKEFYIIDINQSTFDTEERINAAGIHKLIELYSLNYVKFKYDNRKESTMSSLLLIQSKPMTKKYSEDFMMIMEIINTLIRIRRERLVKPTNIHNISLTNLKKIKNYLDGVEKKSDIIKGNAADFIGYIITNDLLNDKKKAKEETTDEATDKAKEEAKPKEEAKDFDFYLKLFTNYKYNLTSFKTYIEQQSQNGGNKKIKKKIVKRMKVYNQKN